jgi:hypothetical protein
MREKAPTKTPDTEANELSQAVLNRFRAAMTELDQHLRLGHVHVDGRQRIAAIEGLLHGLAGRSEFSLPGQRSVEADAASEMARLRVRVLALANKLNSCVSDLITERRALGAFIRRQWNERSKREE